MCVAFDSQLFTQTILLFLIYDICRQKWVIFGVMVKFKFEFKMKNKGQNA